MIDNITLITVIMYLIVNCVGSIFGFISRNYSKKVGKLESENVFEKVGSIIAIIGIVANTFLVILSVYDIICVLFLYTQPKSNKYF